MTSSTASTPLTWGDLPTGWRADFCNEFEASRGEVPSDHADPADYTMAELRALEKYGVCPLHIHADYPYAPIASVSRDAGRISDHFDKLTEQNTGKPFRHAPGMHGPWVVTRGQLDRLAAEHPHGRQWLEDNARELGLTVTDGE